MTDINICIIMMTSRIGTLYKKDFDKSFDKNVKLHYLLWSDKNLIKYLLNNKINGIILSGSKYRILDEKKKIADLPKKILKINIPILGICYGYQWLIKKTCGKKCLDHFRNKYNKLNEYGKFITITKPFKVNRTKYFLTHHDYITKVPKNWKVLIKTGDQIWMAYNKKSKILGVQFHPEYFKKTRKYFFRKWIKYIYKK